jgi:hypothetical protein
MMTMNVTLPSGRKNDLLVFKILFQDKDFDLIVDKVSTVKSVEDLYQCSLWNVVM